MSKASKIIYLIVCCLFFIFFNRFFSHVIINSVTNFPSNSLLDVVLVKNTGAAFSILEGSKLFLILFSILAIVCILFYAIKNLTKASAITIFWVALLIAGIFCNLYERIIQGYVIDFFKLNFINFPVFNISDIFINISVFAIVIIIMKHSFSKNNEIDN